MSDSPNLNCIFSGGGLWQKIKFLNAILIDLRVGGLGTFPYLNKFIFEAYMSVTIQSRRTIPVPGAGDQMLMAASGRPQSRTRHEEERQSQEHLLLASRDEHQ